MKLTIALLLALVAGVPSLAQETSLDRKPPDETKTEIRIPLLFKNGRMYINATVGLRRALLLVDTGTQITSFVMGLVPEHKGVIPGKVEMRTATGRCECPQLDVPVIIQDWDGEPVRKIVSGVFGPFDYGIAQGVLGMDFLGQYKSVKFDFKGQTMVLEKESEKEKP
jgi:hypothetical protein